MTAGLVTAVDLVRGLGVLTDMEVVDVPGATGWFDTNYEGKRDAALDALADGADLFVVHVEATDEAGHAGNVDEKVKALENWDRRILAGLVDGPRRPRARGGCCCCPTTPRRCDSRPTPSDPVPYLLVGDGIDGRRRHLHRGRRRRPPVVPGHELCRGSSAELGVLVAGGSSGLAGGPARVTARASSAVTSKGLKPTSHHVTPTAANGPGVAAGGGVDGDVEVGRRRAHGVDELGQLLGLVDLHREVALPRAPPGAAAPGSAIDRRPTPAGGGAAPAGPEPEPVDGEGLAAVVHLLARPRRHAHLEALVEQRRPPLRVGLLVEGRQLPPGVAAEPDAEGDPPDDSRSSDATSRASFHGRRRGTGVTIGPMRTRSVADAIAASVIHGSAMSTTGAR